jgi:DASH complex subunit DAD2
VLAARIAEKKAELANLKELQALSAGLADQMQMLADKLTTLSDGTEGMYPTHIMLRQGSTGNMWQCTGLVLTWICTAVAAVLSNWHNVLRAINMASSEST